jgi:fatty acid desaturase
MAADVSYPRDYSLTGPDAVRAVERGLASAEWYQAPIPRKRMKELMQRSDGPAIRDTAIWVAAFIVTGGMAAWLFPGWASVPFFLAYGVLYGSSTDSRWHECGHGTAFKTRWMNDVVYQVACFMIFRNPNAWRWSHARHHTDTIIVGRDPEIAIMRPTVVAKVVLLFFGIPQTIAAVRNMVTYATGTIPEDQTSYIPEMERAGVVRVARVWIVIHLAVIAVSVWAGSILPMLLIGPLPTMYGAWLHVVTGITQHGGLAEDALDHRLNSRTVLMNPLLRFLYWNMNYHIEHHMYPMVPYHALPALHEEAKPYLPKPSAGLIAAYREILPAILRQASDPSYVLRPELPGAAPRDDAPATAVPAE